MKINEPVWLGVISATLFCAETNAVTTTFFDASEGETLISTNLTSDTVSSRGYLFTYSLDKWWSAGLGGAPTGRSTSVNWPDGVQAQAVTVAPPGGTTGSASITLRRVDGKPFALESFKAKLLANTAATGAAIEIMPQLNGQDAFNDPVMFDATGYGGMIFPYSTTLAGYDTYIVNLWTDFALVGLTVSDASVPAPVTLSATSTATNTIRLAWPANATGYFLQASTSLKPGSFADVVIPSTIQGTNQVVVLPTTNSMTFFRLVQ
jgi:hypothetical protein